jgi:hypothetical protein
MKIKDNLIWVGLAGQLFCYIVQFTEWHAIKEWFYLILWWSYILLIDGIIYRRRGDSLIISRTKSFLMMLPWSVLIWLVFELANLRLRNWYYVDLTPILWQRWLGYLLAFATVLPGLFETYEFLETLGLFRNKSAAALPNPTTRTYPTSRLNLILLAGILSLILSVAFPRYCFPFIWVGFALLLEPVNYRLGGGLFLRILNRSGSRRTGHNPVIPDGLPSGRNIHNGNDKKSLYAHLLSVRLFLTGRWEKVFRLFTAGLICGILWEFWNSLAVSHWVYNIPYFSFGRIFEMPILGYLGFLPFAGECYLMYEFVVLTGYGRAWQSEGEMPVSPPSRRLVVVAYGLLAIFSVTMFYLLDRITVHG